jgi:hypothetical protein
MMVQQIKGQRLHRNAKLPECKTNPKVLKYGNTKRLSET